MNSPAEGYRETFTEFVRDRFFEWVPFSTCCLASFGIAIGIAIWITARRKPMACRLALIPYSFVPFLISAFGFVWETVDMLSMSGNGSMGFDYFHPNSFLRAMGDQMMILVFGILFSTVLLIVSSVLIFVTPTDDRKP